MRDSIVTLENGINYYIYEDLDMNGKKYVIGSMIDVYNQDLDTDNLLVKEIVKDGDSYAVTSIEDEKIAQEVSKLLISKIQVSNEEQGAE
jgi:hypothetical protein